MPSIFTRIINGEIPCYKVAEDEHFFAFLDIRPMQKGHTLVVPKKEIDYIFDLDSETYTGLHAFAQRVAIALKQAVPCTRIGVMVIGDEVPHAHIHLIPINHAKDMKLGKPTVELSAEEMQEVAGKIRLNF